MHSPEHPADIFIRFVETFTPGSRPKVISMSGGEALLRPDLVRRLANRAREVGTRSSVLSGLFFATARRIPPSILEAIRSVDHFSVSIDQFHERLVPRADVFRVLHTVLECGIDVSIHVVGHGKDDPYLQGIVEDVRRTFDERVPMFVNSLSAFGRARTWLIRKRVAPLTVEANPCAMVAWPVVGFDGTIVACGNDDALDDVPAHLRLGHAAVDDWETIRARSLESHMLRAIRLFGPQYMVHEFGGGASDASGGSGYCASCMGMSNRADIEERVASAMNRPSTAVLEEEVARLVEQSGAISFARRHGISSFAELITMGSME